MTAAHKSEIRQMTLLPNSIAYLFRAPTQIYPHPMHEDPVFSEDERCLSCSFHLDISPLLVKISC
jgi:hypothetical protein